MSTPHTSRDTFIYLLHFVTLAASAIALGNVWFAFVDRWTTSPAPYDRFHPGNVTAGLSALVIAGPVYLILSWWMRKLFGNGTLPPSSSLRKWLMYLAVFAASIIGMADLIATLNTYLNGDFTARFFLKAMTILTIAGSIFAFYLWDIRREQPVASPVTKAALGASILVLLATIVTGFVLVGSPKTRRLLQWDQQRVDILRGAVYELYYPASEGSPLPEGGDRFVSQFLDPETSKPLEYRKIDGDTFEVCATFALPAEEAALPIKPYTRSFDPYSSDPDMTALQRHGAGRQCYEYTVVPQKRR